MDGLEKIRPVLSHAICSLSPAIVMSGVYASLSLDHPGLYFMRSSTYYHYSSSTSLLQLMMGVLLIVCPSACALLLCVVLCAFV